MTEIVNFPRDIQYNLKFLQLQYIDKGIQLLIVINRQIIMHLAVNIARFRLH